MKYGEDSKKGKSVNGNKRKLSWENTMYFVSDFEMVFKKIHVNNFLESIIANGYKYQPQADCLARFSGAVKINKPIAMQTNIAFMVV